MPNCRAYEMVSPLEKNSIDVGAQASTIRSSTNGDDVIFAALGAFADTESTGVTTQYKASRDSGGWATRGILPPRNPNILGPSYGVPRYLAFNDDLTAGVVRTGDPVLAPGAPEGMINLYRGTLSPTRSYDLLTPQAGLFSPDPFTQPAFVDASTDFRRILIESPYALTEDATLGTNLYEWADGILRRVGIVPASAGSTANPVYEGANINQTRQTMSEDGSRIFFHVPPSESESQLYMQESGGAAIHVSASQRSTPDPNGTQPARFEAASPDGSVAYFASSEQLVDADTNSNADLYQYEVRTGELTVLTLDQEPADAPGEFLGVVKSGGASPYVYFVTSSQIVAGAPTAESRAMLYVAQAGEVRFVTVLDLGNHDSPNWTDGFETGQTSRISPDGTRLVFQTASPQLGYDNNGHKEVYLYNALDNQMVCMSCRTDGAPATSDGTVTPFRYLYSSTQYLSRAISAGGARIFFETGEPLVGRDVNGVTDVYMWDGQPHLISTGTEASPAHFGDASSSGDDVFFTTADRLVAADTDNNSDLYNARVDGGWLSVTPSPGCSGAECPRDTTAPPPAPVPASAVLRGAGNERARSKARCRKGGQVKRGKARCGKKRKPAKRMPRSGTRPARADGGKR